MTVSELIDILRLFPQDDVVKFLTEQGFRKHFVTGCVTRVGETLLFDSSNCPNLQKEFDANRAKRNPRAEKALKSLRSFTANTPQAQQQWIVAESDLKNRSIIRKDDMQLSVRARKALKRAARYYGAYNERMDGYDMSKITHGRLMMTHGCGKITADEIIEEANRLGYREKP